MFIYLFIFTTNLFIFIWLQHLVTYFTNKTLLYIKYNFTNFTLITYNKIKLEGNC